MFPKKSRRALSRKITSSLVAFVFLFSSFDATILPAVPARTENTEKLAVPSIWRPLAHEGYAITEELQFELLLATRLVYKNRETDLEAYRRYINAVLENMYEARRDALEREAEKGIWAGQIVKFGGIKFERCEWGDGQLTVIFKFNNRPETFRITYADTVPIGEEIENVDQARYTDVFVASDRYTIERVRSSVEAARASSAHREEPLIGHGFTIEEIEEGVRGGQFTVWSESEAFSKTVKELEDAIRIRAPTIIGDRAALRLLQILSDFKEGKNGARMGIIPTVYTDPDHYYLEVGTPHLIGLVPEFFQESDPLSRHRTETLFHALFHAMRSIDGVGEDFDEYAPVAHIDAMRFAARLFWDLSEEQAQQIPSLSPRELERHPKNELGAAIREWKKRQSGVSEALLGDDVQYLLKELRVSLDQRRPARLRNLLASCDDELTTRPRYPVEGRYPILRAVALLDSGEQEKLVRALKKPQNHDIRNLPVVDSILLMLDQDIPKDWTTRQVPQLQGRTVWQVSSETWNPGGGLGRVMQFHGLGILELLRHDGVSLAHIEPLYRYGKNKNTGLYEELDYATILGIDKSAIKEVERFTMQLGMRRAEAVCYETVNKFGVKVYFIEGYREGDDKTKPPYYTEALYRYRTNGEPNLVTIQEFSAFFSIASLELVRRVEAKKKEAAPDTWRAPVMHFNDGQLGLAPYFKRKYYRDDPILGGSLSTFSTHTYPNRIFWGQSEGERILESLGIPKEDWKYFHHRIGSYAPVVDFTSAGIRTADWIGGVSAKHADDIMAFKYDNWGDWTDLDLIALTNGDVRSITTHKFRTIMREVCGDSVDVEHPTPEQVLKTKRRAKEILGLSPDLPTLSYSGRCVSEKAGRNRALSDANIEALVKMGVQVIVGANVQGDPQVIHDLAILYDTLKKKKEMNPGEYPGQFFFMCNIDIEDQRGILAASDIQVQDSDPSTEAAGYSEADVSACGGLELAPPWREGILQAQGMKINLGVLGEGNTLTPDIKIPEAEYDKYRRPNYDIEANRRVGEAYLKAIRDLLAIGRDMNETLEKISHYQATSIRLSRILEARLTAAEYLRQWNGAVVRKDAAREAIMAEFEGRELTRQEQFDIAYRVLVAYYPFLATQLKGLQHLVNEEDPAVVDMAISNLPLVNSVESPILRLAFRGPGEGVGGSHPIMAALRAGNFGAVAADLAEKYDKWQRANVAARSPASKAGYLTSKAAKDATWADLTGLCAVIRAMWRDGGEAFFGSPEYLALSETLRTDLAQMRLLAPQISRLAPVSTEPEDVIEGVRGSSGIITTHFRDAEKTTTYLSRTVIIMKRNLPEVVTGSKDSALQMVLQDQYKVMRQGLRKLFPDMKEIVEVDTQEELVSAMNAFIGTKPEEGYRVIVLDDGTLTKGCDDTAVTIPGVTGTAGVNYCAVTTAAFNDLAETTIPFVNLHAMAMIGVSILNNDQILFRAAYEAFTGDKLPSGLIDDMTGKIKWIVKALPRIVKFATDSLDEQQRLKRLFAVAA